MAEQQSEFRTQHGEFQASMAEVLRSHDNQLAAKVATQQSLVIQMGEFQQVVGAVLTSQTETQRLMNEQLRVMKEQLNAIQTPGRGRKDRGPLKLKIFDGTGDPDNHIHHYEAVGLTEGWTE